MTTVDHPTPERLRKLLDRKAVPRHLEGKLEAQADEVAALLAILDRFAPATAEEFDSWWRAVEAELGPMLKSYWPNEKNVDEACRNVRARQLSSEVAPQLASNVITNDQAVMHAARSMTAGGPVGEQCLFGVIAAELELRELVEPEVLSRYRQGAYAMRQKQYGGDSARRWYDEQKAQHELALAAARARLEKAK